MLGNFETDYLKIPKDVLTTTMISHQKYFPVVDADGSLMAHFVTINNTVAKDPAVVARGNEKVIRARLADAKFFFEEDQKTPLMTHFEELKKVVFHSALGTSYDKVMQFRELAAWIADKVNPALKDTRGPHGPALQGRSGDEDGLRVPRAPGDDGTRVRPHPG